MSNYVIDDTEKDDIVVPVQYDITSFGADYDVEGLVNRLKRDDILIPPFQRGYVWSLTEASRFIESLLLGLPVPGVFLAKEPDLKRLLVIDGQQRLRTLQYFYEGFFNPKEGSKTRRIFRLTGVQQRYNGATYKTLSETDKVTLNDSIIHATIVKQETPKDDDTSIYHIFERLNTSGRRLAPQQIRVAIYHGDFISLIHELNDMPNWRLIFGPYSKTLKDQELIIRFLALYFFPERYHRPMEEFLNLVTKTAHKHNQYFYKDCASIFSKTIEKIYSALGKKAFRPERSLNAAVFDSVMVGVAKRLSSGVDLKDSSLKAVYERMLADKKYIDAISQSTSDEANVEARLKYATNIMATAK